MGLLILLGVTFDDFFDCRGEGSCYSCILAETEKAQKIIFHAENYPYFNCE